MPFFLPPARVPEAPPTCRSLGTEGNESVLRMQGLGFRVPGKPIRCLLLEISGSVFPSSRLIHASQIPWSSKIVHHPCFDAFYAIIVVANAVFIGFDVQWVLDGGGARPAGYIACHYIFSLLFLIELLLRLADSRCRYLVAE